MRSFPCPKCKRMLQQCGEVSLSGGPPLPVFQCDDCTTPSNLFGVAFNKSYTFGLDADGKPFTPDVISGSSAEQN